MINQETAIAYQDKILPGVSRTFALTIPQLPDKLRHVVANAYLLCRIADTIEDDDAIPNEQKPTYQQQFIDVVKGKLAADQFARQLYPLLSANTLKEERELIANTAQVIELTHSFSTKQRKIIERCVTIMCQGMSHFAHKMNVHGLANLRELDRYCYVVAGVVGELLTDLFCDYSGKIAENRNKLFKLAVSFGQGLQMTNILKDIWDDRKHGACWLPQEVFQNKGFDIKNLSLSANDKNYNSGLEYLIGVTHTHLQNALSYTLLLPKQEKGIRCFCLWAIGLAVLTLRNIQKNPSFTDRQQIKVSRRMVKVTIGTTSLLAPWNRMLLNWFNWINRRLPVSPLAKDWKPADFCNELLGKIT